MTEQKEMQPGSQILGEMWRWKMYIYMCMCLYVREREKNWYKCVGIHMLTLC